VALLVTVLVVIRNILVLVLERPPRVEAVPEVVEVLDLLLGGVLVTEPGDGLGLGEAALGLEDGVPELVEVAGLGLLLGRGLDISALIDGVELAALGGVEENLGGLLDALEEAVILGGASGSLLIWVMAENLLAVGALDLVLSGLVTVLGKSKNGVVILLLCGC
jgi:hypothetical protein